MKLITWLNALSLTGLFLLVVLFVFVSILVGKMLGALNKQPPGGEETAGAVVGAMLGLLALMLAFTFNMASSRFDARKQLFVDEVSAIGTAHLRAGLLPSPYREDARHLLRSYVDLRVEAAHNPRFVAEGIARSEQIQDRLWGQMEALIAGQPATPAQSLFVESLNEVIDLHGQRVTVALQFRIPDTVWLGLYAVTALAMMSVGFQLRQSRHRPLLFNLILALAFSAVIVLIADLDRGSGGTVLVNQQSLFELQSKLQPEDR